MDKVIIDIHQPTLVCTSCKYVNQDYEDVICPKCRTSSYQIIYQWIPFSASRLQEGWIFLDEAIFLEGIPLQGIPHQGIPIPPFPRRLLLLQDNGIGHTGFIEEKHMMEELDFWAKYALDQIQPHAVQDPQIRWRESKTRITCEESKECSKCGTLMPKGKMHHLQENTHMAEILPGIFLGAQWNAFCEQELKVNKIQSLVNCAIEIGDSIHLKRFGPEHYLKVKWDDSFTQEWKTNELDEILKWIESQQQLKRNILIHCALGKSRSVSIIIYLLMKQLKLSYDEALRMIRDKKPYAQPNSVFESRLYRLS